VDRIERALCKEIAPVLEASGFALRKNWGYFVRSTAYGHDAFVVVNKGTASGSFFGVGLVIDVRHDRIEVPWNRLGFIYGDDNQKQTTTLVLGYPPRQRGHKASVMKVTPATMKDDIVRVAREIESAFTERALPFYRRFCDLKEIEALANEVPLADLAPYTVGLPMEDRAMRSLLLAKAVNPARYAAVREAFVTLDQGMFPREKRLEMLRRVDEMPM
jgi:hypothetical protein